MLRQRQSLPLARKARKLLRAAAMAVAASVIMIAATSQAPAQATDPGPRGGPAGAGGFYPTLNANEQQLFNQAMGVFMEVDSVSGTIEAGSGLGPTFNGNSCAMCHAQPATGGSSPGMNSPQNPVANPQVALATLDGAMNTVPSFITTNGPVREARFVSTSPTSLHAALDGGVHDLYTIQGRTDAPGCTLAQPNFTQAIAQGNVIYRIPTPTYGLGLVENTPDSTLLANFNATASARKKLGIGGSFNTSGNDGSITRFGWKAQNKSLLIFAGEAYNVEQGVTNEAFPNERNTTTGCQFNTTPEDSSHILNGTSTTGTLSEMSADLVNFAAFMRLLAPPTSAPSTTSTTNGAALFNQIGCNLCHSTSLQTGTSPYTGMSNVTYQPYSDFALHHMGAGLADGILQGNAGPDQFRTAPLWGLGQRLFFLHDGRTTDLVAAIAAHSFSSSKSCAASASAQVFFVGANNNKVFEPASASNSCNSEANAVIDRYNKLNSSQQQDLLNFLRSL
ncbi:MAG TPA: di-heme oxidoredictase family protein [Candidatus Solibacter sp.]|nr:di-heme oxidoredictase family protein [Candidatus Solibacter sp.]